MTCCSARMTFAVSLRTGVLKILLVTSSLLLAGCSSVRDDGDSLLTRTSSGAQPIIGGTDVDVPGVVQVLMRSHGSARDVRVVCTGAIIAPHVVLTAAHCLDPEIAGPGQYGVFVGNDSNDDKQFTDPRRFFTAKRTTLHPRWDRSHRPPGAAHDIGVIVTSGVLPGAPLPLNGASELASLRGATVRSIGAGRTRADADQSSGTLHQYEATVTEVTNDYVVFADEGRSTCVGDSGGPSLVTRNGRDVIVGVHSYGEHHDSCTGKNYDQRVDGDATSFVEDVVREVDADFSFVRDTNIEATTPARGAAGEGTRTPAAAIPSGPNQANEGCTVRGVGPDDDERAPLATAVSFALAALVTRRRRSPR